MGFAIGDLRGDRGQVGRDGVGHIVEREACVQVIVAARVHVGLVEVPDKRLADREASALDDVGLDRSIGHVLGLGFRR